MAVVAVKETYEETCGSEGRRVLIADSSAFVRIMLSIVLRKMGFDVVGLARDCEEAERKCIELAPDILILDANLEGGDGINVMRRILRENAATVIILLFPDAKGMSLKAAEAVRAGAVGFLRKPLSEGELRRNMERMLADEGVRVVEGSADSSMEKRRGK
ncbi:MAG: response regulator [Candidatus Methanospirare jalkutatii]|nr:response regulator [Methanophagales archaeon]MCW7080845.1 response regulator [Candidatus Methanospirare jalkutatii]